LRALDLIIRTGRAGAMPAHAFVRAGKPFVVSV
jgi:hypothetical protein